MPHKPPPLPANIPKTTKLQPEESKEAEGDPDPTTAGVPQPATEENEVEGPPLSSKISPADAAPSQDIAITLVPVTAVCVLVVGLGMGVWSMRNKFCGNRKSKEDTVRGWDSYKINLKNGKDGIEERGYSGFQVNLGCIWKCMKIFIISIYESNVSVCK